MRPSKNIIDFIHSFEGYHKAMPDGRCTAYPDVGNPSTGEPWTIGFGTTQYRGPGLKKYKRAKVLRGDVLTEAEAETEFLAHVNYVAQVVNRLNPNLNQHQFDAAVSFFHNNGFYNSAGEWSLQAQRLKDGDLARFEIMLPQYTKGGNGVTLAGLVRRRQGELAIWRKGGSKVSKVGWLALTRRNDKYILSAMDNDTALHEHEFTTTAGLISLLRQYPDAGTTVVTKEGWEPAKKELGSPQPSTNVATLIKTTTRLPNNLVQLLLRVGDESIPCVSGQGYAQFFRKPSDPRSVPGNMEPIPQGRYVIGQEEWAGAPGDWNKLHSTPGIGPWWVAITATFSDDRGSFGFHSDYGPVGSAGCVVFQTRDNAERFLSSLRKFKPRYLDVQWGL